MKASRLVVSLISSVALLGAASSVSAQSTPDDQVRANGASCGAVSAVADTEAQYAEHDSVYDSLNGITNDSPVNKKSRLGWKKNSVSNTGSVSGDTTTMTDTGVQYPEHDTVYDSLNGITNDSPVNKGSRMGWKKYVVSNAGSPADDGQERRPRVDCN